LVCFIFIVTHKTDFHNTNQKNTMPTYPVIPCKNCSAAIQEDSFLSSKKSFHADVFKRNYSSELDSEDFAHYCRGQGSFYSFPKGKFALPLNGSHFNFSGTYIGLCCYCALGSGYSLVSFNDVGCYHCKTRCMLIREFSKLKHQGRGRDGSWEACGWAGLSDSLIDFILRMIVGEKVKLMN
jgi:hypothetical protein